MADLRATLERFIDATADAHELPPLVKMVLVHAPFETISFVQQGMSLSDPFGCVQQPLPA